MASTDFLSMSSNPKLRIGIMALGPTLPLWQQQCIAHILDAGLGEIVLWIVDDAANYPPASTFEKIKRTGFSKLLFNAFLRTAYRPKSGVAVSVEAWWNSAPKISCTVTKKGKWSQYFSKADLETIASYNLDIVFRFGFNIIRGEILKVPKYGVWSFHHDDEMQYRGGPPCFWEIYQRNPETGSVLQRLTDKLDGGIVLKKGVLRTKDYSYAANVDQAYFESAKWPAWVIQDIIAGNTDYLTAAPTTTTAPIYKYPNNFQFLKFLGILAGNILSKAYFRLFVMQQWNVGLVKGSLEDILSGKGLANAQFLPLKNKHTFNADCFGIVMGDKTFIYFEELDYSQKPVQGIIRFSVINEKGEEAERGSLEMPPIQKHASYPATFKDGDNWYLLPETGTENVLNLYQSAGLPAKWNLFAQLGAGKSYTDATLLHHEGKYWLFYTYNNPLFDGDLHLHIAYSNSIAGPYTEHQGNPVKISARSARPAGNFFKLKDGSLCRPAQNFTKTYGGSIVLNRVLKLTEEEFTEEEINEVMPMHPHYRDGIHTLNQIGEQTFVVDMKRHKFKGF